MALLERGDCVVVIKTAVYALCCMVIFGCAKAPTLGKLFEESLAKAKAGDAEAQETVGYLYMTGRGVHRNHELAREWYEASAMQGNALAEAAIGELEVGLPGGASLADQEQDSSSETGVIGVSGGAYPGRDEFLVDPGLALAVAILPVSSPVSISTDSLSPRILVSDDFFTREDSLSIAGQVQDESPIREILIGGMRTRFEHDGRFGIRMAVPIGKSKVEVSATDVAGNSTKRFISIRRSDTPDAEATSVGPGIDFGRFHALVIGNDDYNQLQPLGTAIADAETIASLLANDYGYEVQALYNATRTQMRFALSSYRNALTESDNLLIYYAGHGRMDERANEAYWLPVDASLGIDTNWISNSTLSTTLRAIEAKHVIVVADSCYSGTLTRGIGIGDRVESYLEHEARALRLRRISSGRSRTALTSGANEPVEDNGEGGHSVFANAFIEALKANTGVVAATDLYIGVRRSVMLKANQTPQYGNIRMTGHESGDYLFVRVSEGSTSDAASARSNTDTAVAR